MVLMCEFCDVDVKEYYVDKDTGEKRYEVVTIAHTEYYDEDIVICQDCTDFENYEKEF
tara:strand:+ start:1199 stop:1372 length:174 start_codon:yes stop_codon:yes gene_type:complete